jgi:UDP-N-acetylglucosamine 4,6-dehydratase/5-epimerase
MEKINESVVLITGGTGSFGVAFLEKLILLGSKEIRILSRDENKQFELKKKFPHKNIRWFIGDVRDIESIKDAIRGSDYIFHAAALKQVPTLENFPIEATKTNVIGTENVLNLAIDYQVKRVIVLSTDKSIQPIGVMGLTKSLMEKVVLAKAALNQKPIFNILRYGNVIGSRGSVIPLFIDAIKQQQSIVVHQLDSTRFMLSMVDAIDIVIEAMTSGLQGEIFIPKIKSASLRNIIHALESLLNKKAIFSEQPLRVGDKLHEQLIDQEEYAYSFMKHNHYIINGLKQTLTSESVKPFSSENQQLNIQEIIHLIQQSMTQK